MAFDLIRIRKQAEKKDDENSRFRIFLKTRRSLPSDEIDARVFDATRRVWAGIDCTQCANCCREVKPEFSDEEVDRLARRLEMPRQQFIETFLERSDSLGEKPFTTKTTAARLRPIFPRA